MGSGLSFSSRGVPLPFLSLYIFDSLGLGYHLCFDIGLDLVFIVSICDFGLYENFVLINIHGHVYVLYGSFDVFLFIHGIGR